MPVPRHAPRPGNVRAWVDNQRWLQASTSSRARPIAIGQCSTAPTASMSGSRAARTTSSAAVAHARGRVYRAAADVRGASSVGAGLHGFGESVLSVVPDGFSEYVRVFHPAYRSVGSQRVAVTWAEIAAANGMRMHAGVQLGSITGSEAMSRKRSRVRDATHERASRRELRRSAPAVWRATSSTVAARDCATSAGDWAGLPARGTLTTPVGAIRSMRADRSATPPALGLSDPRPRQSGQPSLRSADARSRAPARRRTRRGGCARAPR